MITHSVFFRLKFPKGSSEEATFLSAAAKLSTLPAVKNFASLKQTSSKNDFDYGLTMEFENQEEYNGYNIHPDHVSFVNTYWEAYVEKFLEIDYEVIG
ncbi:Dabb family protein [Algoriphagus aquimarinus]|uniref:Dabb family protein n=1 Tax=Algoriphagus aquimarinus TaxID=237018 RepID=UPI0030DB78DF|tara:strand:+ start:14320 stop:14613 length:294 start_codon:yes stop_codon:yes gene_type:complete